MASVICGAMGTHRAAKAARSKSEAVNSTLDQRQVNGLGVDYGDRDADLAVRTERRQKLKQ